MTLPPTLIGLSPGILRRSDVPAFLRRVEESLAGGLRAVLLREQGLGDRHYLELALGLRARLDAVDGWLGVHDRVHLAPAAKADGIHLGFRSLTLHAVPQALHAERAVGLSTHAGDALDARAPLSYVFHGPVYATPSKAGLLEPTGVGGLSAACQRSAVPVWALGGLLPEHAAEVLAAGARGLAVLGGLLGSADARAAAAAYCSAIAGPTRAAPASGPTGAAEGP